jgi:hypothetical protein
LLPSAVAGINEIIDPANKDKTPIFLSLVNSFWLVLLL